MASKADPFECPVCHELYRTPKILPCCHLACRDCIASWLKKGVQGGCPTCRASILSPTPPPDLDNQVDALPTDFVTWSLVESHQVLQGPHTCAMCPNNVAATSYCFECAVKLCTTCSNYHKRLPGTKGHSLQDLNTLTDQDLSAHFQSCCQNHSATKAEVYCSSHQELICWECATTHHRVCPELKAIADVAEEAREELDQQLRSWRRKEAALCRQMKSRKDKLSHQLKHVNDAFDDLQQHVEKRRQELCDIIKKQESSDASLEETRVSVTSHAAILQQVLTSPTDGVVLRMKHELQPRRKEVEEKLRKVDDLKAVQELDLDSQTMADIKSALSALGAPVVSSSTSTTSSPTTSTTPTRTIPTPTIHTPNPTIPTPTTTTPQPVPAAGVPGMTTGASSSSPTTPKPTGPALARVLKLGDRVKYSTSYEQRDPLWFLGYRGPGTVTAIPSRRAARGGRDPQGRVDVRWDTGYEEDHCMGCDNQYDLELV